MRLPLHPVKGFPLPNLKGDRRHARPAEGRPALGPQPERMTHTRGASNPTPPPPGAHARAGTPRTRAGEPTPRTHAHGMTGGVPQGGDEREGKYLLGRNVSDGLVLWNPHNRRVLTLPLYLG